MVLPILVRPTAIPIPPPAGGGDDADFFVDATAGGGGDGSSGSPWTNTEFEGQSFSAGDIIEFDGTFADTFVPPSNGTQVSPIIYRASNDGATFNLAIDVTGAEGNWTNVSGNRWSRSYTATTVHQLIYTASGGVETNGKRESSAAAVNATDEYHFASNVLNVFSAGGNPATALGKVEVTDNTVPQRVLQLTVGTETDFEVQSIIFRGARNDNIRCNGTRIIFRDCDSMFPVEDGLRWGTNASGNEWINGNIKECGTRTPSGAQDQSGAFVTLISGANNNKVTGTTMDMAAGAGVEFIQSTGANNVFDNITLSACLRTGFNVKSKAQTLKNSTLDGANPQSKFGSQGVLVQVTSDADLTVEKCTVKNFEKTSMCENEGTLRLIRSLFKDPQGNTSGSCLQGGSQVAEGGGSVFAERCIFHDTIGDISTSKGIIDINAGTDYSFKNCVIIDEGGRGSSGFAFKQTPDLADITGTLTLHNVSMISDGGRALRADTAGANLDIDTCHFERDGTTNFVRISGTDYDESDIPGGLNAETGITGTHVTGAPVFKSTTEGNTDFFRPTTGSSPLIGAGVNANAPTNDFNNDAFENPPNIGAVKGDVA